ncbi:YceH family protein [Marinicella sp. W31]|uniref:YceH family protein n=1 Tax=Marinicella sp. W31 TaxID=3023713 RepID=UPI003756841D
MDSENQTQPEQQDSAYFTEIEARVIASLMEKQLTTPNNYPLTMNSLMLACNQKSNREPVMNLTEGQVGHAVNQLENRDLVGVDYGGRANHITHRVMTALELDRPQQAILTALMVRKPLTLNDIKNRTNRMVDFADVNEIHDTLKKMMDREQPLVLHIPRPAGSREDRYTHLLCGEIDLDSLNLSSKPVAKAVHNDELESLKNRIEQLETQVEKLMILLNQAE